MSKIITALALALVVVGTALASEEDAKVVAVLNQFVDGFNKGDTRMITASCAENMSIIDEFSPFLWQGDGACAKWMNDYEANARKKGISDGVVTLSKPKHVDVDGDRAYVVAAANYSYKEKGKPVEQVGSIMTLALHKSAEGWKIVGWSWAQN